ncbi:MAG: hypothetical protein IKA31_02025 [Clostridia bacterium]|nr:hypothetical protein [Clostridia bacterium]
MLNEIKLKETYKVENKKVYAVIKETGSKRPVNGCDVRVELAQADEVLAQRQGELEAELNEIIKQRSTNQKLDNQLAALGYCKKDKPIYKKIDGITMRDANGNPLIEKYIHQNDCPSRGC